MDHLCYLDQKENEYYKLLSGEKTALARGTRFNKPPFKHVFSGDRIFFVDNDEKIVLCAEVAGVINTSKNMKNDREEIFAEHTGSLVISQSTAHKLMKKNYIVIISLCNIKKVDIIDYPKANSVKKNEWVLAGSIQQPE